MFQRTTGRTLDEVLGKKLFTQVLSGSERGVDTADKDVCDEDLALERSDYKRSWEEGCATERRRRAIADLNVLVDRDSQIAEGPL